MTDNLPPLPPCAPEFKPRWPNDPGGYTADQMKAYASAAIAAQHVPQYDQQALELCEACGWKTLIPDEGCLNCERKPQPQPQPVQKEPCPECDGTGTVAGSQAHFPCPLCTSPQAAQPQPQPVQQLELTEYDAGLLNDFGGGNVEWWQDYIRAELGRAFEHYQSQVPAQGEKQ